MVFLQTNTSNEASMHAFIFSAAPSTVQSIWNCLGVVVAKGLASTRDELSYFPHALSGS